MMYLDDPVLGRLDLHDPSTVATAHGLVVTGFTVGSPAVREVVRDRPLADGGFDDSTYLGVRAVTVSVTANEANGDPTVLLGRLAAFLSPLRRPRLVWSIPGSTAVRSAVVRGVGMPVPVVRKRLHQVVASWVTVGSFLEAEDEVCASFGVAAPGSEVVPGRVYDLAFDRAYPDAPVTGEQTLTNDGDAPADWVATLYGPIVDPTLVVGDVSLVFDRNGGVTLAAGQSLVIDTLARTILFNGDPDGARGDRVNFLDWQWADLRMQPGVTTFRYLADVAEVGASARVCWRSAWH